MTNLTNAIPNPLFDKLVKANVYIVQLKISEYLQLIDLEENPYQRNVLDYDVYKKLIRDLLNGAIFPPISVVCKSKVDLKHGLDRKSKLMILDGLQRTNCLFVCKDILDEKIEKKDIFPSIYKNSKDFLDTVITIEIWEGLDLRAILYKIIVLNTGQKKMDIRHQLDIMISSLKDFLKMKQIKFIEIKEKIEEELTVNELQKDNIFPLYTIAESIVAYINRYPQFTQKSATEFLFEKLDLEPESFKEGIKIIEDETTYDDLVWTLKDLSEVLLKKYNYNVFIRYPLFLSSFLAAMGYARVEFGGQVDVKKNTLIEMLKSAEQDPLGINTYLSFHNKFISGIGAKRRKLVFTSFKNFFSSPVTNKLDWHQAYKEVK